MKFNVEYTNYTEQKVLLYRAEEHSFEMIPWEKEIDFDIAINTLTLTVSDTKIIQLSGFCGLNTKMKVDYNVPESKKGLLTVLGNFEYGFAYRIKDKEFSVYVNTQTGWICIGDPLKQGNAVEFINNCIAVIDKENNFVSLWLKPQTLPTIQRALR